MLKQLFMPVWQYLQETHTHTHKINNNDDDGFVCFYQRLRSLANTIAWHGKVKKKDGSE